MKLNTNNWKLTIRNLVQQRKSSLLNISGLAFGFAAVLFLSIYVYREFTYDTFHEHADRIFKPEFEIVEAKADIDIASNLSLQQIEAFRENVPGINAITFLNYSRWDWDNGALIEYNGNKINVGRLAFSDQFFDEVFSFQTHSGNLSVSLADPNKLVLTKDIALKIFGNEDPIGKMVLLNNKPIVISSILQQLPSNSSIQFDGLVSYQSAKYFFGSEIKDWSNIPFIRVNENTNPLQVSSVISSVMRNTLPEEEIKKIDPVFNTKLIPVKELYFYGGSPFDHLKHGSKSLAYVLMIIGIIILLLAIINYSNLLLATSLKWKKDFGIQRVLGAGRNTETHQLFIKGFIVSIIAFCLSVLIINVTLPWLNQLVNYPLSKTDFIKPQSAVIAFILLLSTITFSGFMPTILNKKTTPLSQIKGDHLSYRNKGGIWKSLVTFQLFVSIALITASLVITKQIQYGLKKDIGITVQNVLTIPTHKLGGKKTAYINTISDHAQTISSCLSTSYINTFTIWGGKLKEPGKEDQSVTYNNVRVNHSFIKTLGLEVVKGRDFMRNISDEKAFIVNQAMLKEYKIDNPLESTIRGYPIIGVVKDFNFNSLHHKIEPLVLWNTPESAGLSSIHFTANTKEEIENYMHFLKSEWNKLAPELHFEFEFADDRLAAMYEKDITLARSIISFSILAIFIACLGIFGLLSYIMEVRMKEIGIRKVNGAKVFEILKLINTDLIKWVTIAFLLACPIAYYAINKWLENFAYKTTLSWWIFALAGLLALGIALLTVSFQSYKAATRNPVEALRYE